MMDANKVRSKGHYEILGEPVTYTFDFKGEQYVYDIMKGGLVKCIEKRTIGKDFVYKGFVHVNQRPLEEIASESFAKVRGLLEARMNYFGKRMPLLYRIMPRLYSIRLKSLLKKASNELDSRLHSYDKSIETGVK